MVRHGCLNLIDCSIVPELEINCAVSGTGGATRAWPVAVLLRPHLVLVLIISIVEYV